MVFTCPACGLQYDCDQLKPGMVYRCSCGEIIPISKIKPKDPRVLFCSACGGPLRKGTATCDYCGGVVTLRDKNLDSLCPSCYTRLPNKACHCFNCGSKVDPIKVPPSGSGRNCPRCSVELFARKLESFSLMECRTCGGLWLTDQTFKGICQDQKDRAAIAQSLGEMAKPRDKTMASKVVYLKCPECGNLMNRKGFARRSGVVIDRCREHGIWLDCHELEEILQFIDSGGMANARKMEVEEQNVRNPRPPRSLFKVSRYAQVAFTERPTPSPKDAILQEIADLLD